MSPPVFCLNREEHSALKITVGSNDRDLSHDIKISVLLMCAAKIVFYKTWEVACKILHIKNVKSVKSSSLQPCQKYCYLYCFKLRFCNTHCHSF